jgi:glutathione S-transferase
VQEWLPDISKGKIPVVLDNTKSPPVSVMESFAILVYLQENYDKDYVFGFRDPAERIQALQWLFFWQSNAPLHGQTAYFLKHAREPMPGELMLNIHVRMAFKEAHSRAVDVAEHLRSMVLRAYSTLEDHLSGRHTGITRHYLAGSDQGSYSIADIGAWPHVRSYRSIGVSEDEIARFPNLLQWIDRIAQRAAVQVGISDKYDSEENPGLVLRGS